MGVDPTQAVEMESTLKKKKKTLQSHEVKATDFTVLRCVQRRSVAHKVLFKEC